MSVIVYFKVNKRSNQFYLCIKVKSYKSIHIQPTTLFLSLFVWKSKFSSCDTFTYLYHGNLEWVCCCLVYKWALYYSQFYRFPLFKDIKWQWARDQIPCIPLYCKEHVLTLDCTWKNTIGLLKHDPNYYQIITLNGNMWEWKEPSHVNRLNLLRHIAALNSFICCSFKFPSVTSFGFTHSRSSVTRGF